MGARAMHTERLHAPLALMVVRGEVATAGSSVGRQRQASGASGTFACGDSTVIRPLASPIPCSSFARFGLQLGLCTGGSPAHICSSPFGVNALGDRQHARLRKRAAQVQLDCPLTQRAVRFDQNVTGTRSVMVASGDSSVTPTPNDRLKLVRLLSWYEKPTKSRPR